MKIYLDIGHGGGDTGAAANGFLEKDLTLKFGLYVRDSLVRAGQTVKCSRESDVNNFGTTASDAIIGSANLANEWRADFFLSIHFNASSNDKSGGAQFIYSHEDEKGKALCEMIADEYQKAGQPLNAIFTRVSSNGQDYYGVIRLTKMQAIIAETAFVTNLQDVERFNDNTFCKNIAEAMSRGVCRYFGLPYKEESGGEKKMYYRVRKSWNDDASQLGAYSDIENARLVADENPGYYVFDDKGKTVYPEKPAACEIKLAELQSKYDKLAAENTALKNKIAKAAELLGS